MPESLLGFTRNFSRWYSFRLVASLSASQVPVLSSCWMGIALILPGCHRIRCNIQSSQHNAWLPGFFLFVFVLFLRFVHPEKNNCTFFPLSNAPFFFFFFILPGFLWHSTNANFVPLRDSDIVKESVNELRVREISCPSFLPVLHMAFPSAPFQTLPHPGSMGIQMNLCAF